MKMLLKKWAGILTVAVLAAGMTACGGEAGTDTKKADTKDLANDYYIDLTDLGMKLNIYLRLDGEGNFIFSNTLDFETDKSSGTFQKSEDEYIMVYSSVNGEEKSVSEGLTSTFTVMEDGSLDFTNTECIHYGSARPTAAESDDPDAAMIAHIVPEDFEAPDTESDFQPGIYVTEDVTEGGVTYAHAVSFYEDNSYVHLTVFEQDGKTMFDCETGTYGISTTQLAMEPANAEGEGHDGRVESEVVDDSALKLSILPYAGAAERQVLDFTKTDAADVITELGGEAEGKEGETFPVTIKIYADGSYESAAEGFTETGILVLDSEEGYVKQYPDHPETGVRGLNQVATVPSGTLKDDNGALAMDGLRIRKSAGLTRYECMVAEK